MQGSAKGGGECGCARGDCRIVIISSIKDEAISPFPFLGQPIQTVPNANPTQLFNFSGHPHPPLPLPPVPPS